MEELLLEKTLGDGSVIRADLRGDVAPTSLQIVIEEEGAVRGQVALAYPQRGVAGGRLLPSPSERLLVLSLYSGQSEEGFELFSLAPTLTHLGGIAYEPGELADFGFSPDELWVVMAVPRVCSEWWSTWTEGEARPTAPGRWGFEFATVLLYCVPTGALTRGVVALEASASWRPRERAYDPYLRPKLDAAGTVSLQLPWGRTSLGPPLPGLTVLAIPEGEV